MSLQRSYEDMRCEEIKSILLGSTCLRRLVRGGWVDANVDSKTHSDE